MKNVALLLVAALTAAGCGSKSADSGAKIESASSSMNMSLSAKSYTELNGPDVVVIGDSATYTVTPALGVTLSSIEWNFGDGTNQTALITDTATHVYKTIGRYTLDVNIIDADGNFTKLTKSVNVIDYFDGLECIPSTNVNSPIDAQVGSVVNVSVDLPSCLSKYVRSVRWTFGDGGTTVAGTSAQNVYTLPGTYTITTEIYTSWVSKGPFLVITNPIHVYDVVVVPTPTPAPTPLPNPLACPTAGATRVSNGASSTRTMACGLDGSKTVTSHIETTETCQSNGTELVWTQTASREVKDSETECMGQSCQLSDGTKLADGGSRVMYSSSSPDVACSAVAQTRVCTNGVLGGSDAYSKFTCVNGCAGFGPNGTTKIGVVTGEIIAPVTCKYGETGVTSTYEQIADQTCSDGQVVTSNTRQGGVKVAGVCPVYQWTATDSWTVCTADCGGQQSRVFECRNDKNEPAPADRCEGRAPTETRVCDGNPEAVKRTEVETTEEDGSSSTACPANQIGVIVNVREVRTTKSYACIDHSVQLASTTVEKGPWVQEKYCRDYVAHRCSQDSLSNSEAFGRHQWMNKCRNEVPAIDDFLNMLEDIHKEAKNKGRNVYPTFMIADSKKEKAWKAPVTDKASCDVPKGAYVAAVCLSSCATPEQQILAYAKANVKAKYTPFKTAHDERYGFVSTLMSHSSMSSKQTQKTKVDQWVTELVDSDHTILEFRTASGGLIRLTPNHPVVADDGTMRLAGEFKVGDNLVKLGGSLDRITSIDTLGYFGKVYNVFVNSADPAQNVVITQGFLNGTAYFQNEGQANLNRTIFRQNLVKGAVK